MSCEKEHGEAKEDPDGMSPGEEHPGDPGWGRRIQEAGHPVPQVWPGLVEATRSLHTGGSRWWQQICVLPQN